MQQRLIALKTGFEALLHTSSSEQCARKLRDLFVATTRRHRHLLPGHATFGSYAYHWEAAHRVRRSAYGSKVSMAITNAERDVLMGQGAEDKLRNFWDVCY